MPTPIKTGYPNEFEIRLEANTVSYSIVENTSTVTFKVWYEALNGSQTFNSPTGQLNLTIDGENISATVNYGLRGHEKRNIYSVTRTFTHEPNGSKRIAVSLSAQMGVIFVGGSNVSGVTTNGWIDLPKVPRPSIVDDMETITLGDPFEVSITKIDSEYRDELRIYDGYTEIKRLDLADGVNVINFTTSELNQIYDSWSIATRGILTFDVATYDGNEVIGQNSAAVMADIPSSVRPNILSVNLTELVEELANQFREFIQGYSRINGLINATAGRGAQITSYTTEINGTTYTNLSNVFQTGTIGSDNTYHVTVTDSRGRATTYEGTFSSVSYQQPRISTFKIERVRRDGSDYVFDNEGTYAKIEIDASIDSVNNNNTKEFRLSYKGNSQSSYSNISVPQNNYSLVTTLYIPNFDVDKSYDFRLEVEDYFNIRRKEENLYGSYTLMNFGADGSSVAFGGPSELPNSVQIKMQTGVLPIHSYMGGIETNNAKKELSFQTEPDAINPHNVTIFGADGNEVESLGIWDNLKSQLVWKYLTSTNEFEFGENINLKQNGLSVLVEALKDIGNVNGVLKTKDGILIQWGKVYVTAKSNTLTSATVNFKEGYSTTPWVNASTVKADPYITNISVQQNKDSFNLEINKMTETMTPIIWIAIGGATQ